MRILSVCMVLALCVVAATALIEIPEVPENSLAARQAVRDYFLLHPDRDQHMAALADVDPVLGVDSGVGRGYDVVTEEVRAPAYLFTYDYGQTWRNPYRGNVKEMYPDQTFLTRVPYKEDKSLMNFFDSFKMMASFKASNMGLKAGLEIEGAKFDFAFQKTKAEAKLLLENSTRFFFMQTRKHGLYQLDTWHDEEPHPRLAKSISRLPSDINGDNRDKYRKMVDLWGTHVVIATQMGSDMNQTVSFDKNLVQKYGQKWSYTQASLSMAWEGFNIGIDTQKASTTAKASSDFDAHSANRHFVAGGNPLLLAGEDGYQKWLASVADNPAMIMQKTKLVPLTRLVGDRTKRKLLEGVIKDYINSGGKK